MTKICDECETVAHCTEHGCIPKQQALDKMAENARELELDYEPAQQQELCPSCRNGDIYACTCTFKPAQQEPVRVPVTDNTYNYAKSLAEAIFKQHFASDEHYSSGRIVWGVNDTVIGILTQIDNMVADMVRKPAQQELVAKDNSNYRLDPPGLDPRYTSPPAQRKPLTDEQITAIYNQVQKDWTNRYDRPVVFARAIEAKLKEKNT